MSIVLDRDPRFTVNFWASLPKSFGTKLYFGTTFHPQTNGKLERIIHTLEGMLRACVLDLGDRWGDHLPLVEV